MIKILNLYAGIGGNRKLWDGDIEVTAVEIDPDIAKIYQDFFPQDKVIVADAHQYLLEHYKEFDFIWSSPPCPSHSRFNLTFKEKRFPDMRLYQEIILLDWFFKGKWVVENVVAYYNPLIEPYIIDGHYFWTNILLSNNKEIRDLQNKTKSDLLKDFGFENNNFSYLKDIELALRNCVHPKTGLYIFNLAFKEKQRVLI
jgi:DNA (cytosine-5)-methyltransferase 1